MYKYFPKYILSKIDLELSNYRKKYPLVLYFYMFNNTFIFTFMYVYTTTYIGLQIGNRKDKRKMNITMVFRCC